MDNINKFYDSAVFQCECCNNYSHNNMYCGQGGVCQGDSENNPKLLKKISNKIKNESRKITKNI